MTSRASRGPWLALPLALNLPGLVGLAGWLYDPLQTVTLVLLPVIALWGLLPGLLFRGAFPGAFRTTEFGIYPETALGWMLGMAFWAVSGFVLAGAYKLVRGRSPRGGSA